MRKVMYGGEMLSRRSTTYVNTPGRLRARSGSKLPEANVPLRALEGGGVTKDSPLLVDFGV